MFLEILGNPLSCQKIFSGVIGRNCRQKDYFGSTLWIRPKLRYKKNLKMSKIEKD
jgi:hypothetical protein